MARTSITSSSSPALPAALAATLGLVAVMMALLPAVDATSQVPNFCAATTSADMGSVCQMKESKQMSARLIQLGKGSIPPHLIVILLDDLGLNDFYKSSDLAAAWPNVARLAAEECVAIEQFYTQSTCTPTRAALMTGRMPIRLGLQHKSIGDLQNYGLPIDEETIADALKAAGYRTMGIGKWHLGAYNNRSLPTRRGFDHFYGFMNSGMHYTSHTTMINGTQYVSLTNDGAVDRKDHGILSAKLFARKALATISHHAREFKAQPLFLYFAIQNPHAPLVESEYMNTTACRDVPNEDRQIFCGLARSADEGIGDVMSSLAKHFPDDDVAVMIAGDNGGQVDHAGNQCASFSDPSCLRGSKGRTYEGGIRNNALLCSKSLLPDSVKGRTYSKGIVHIMDLHATLLHLACIGETSKPLDGFDIWDVVSVDKQSPRRELLVNIDPCVALSPGTEGCVGETAAYRYNGCIDKFCGDWKLVSGEYNSPWCQVPSGDEMECREVIQPGDNMTFLFDIGRDPGERMDLAHEFPMVVRFLQEKVDEARAQMVYACNIDGGSCENDDPMANAMIDKFNAYLPWMMDGSLATEPGAEPTQE
eukprot:NODE_3612_length_2011_cov_2.670913.p1 GENE.NODE_3612_length_2011_cov_2.670913~~NODE_3612_length_2011_cov_2.670913.p1  ORF type:complete len:640 (+),score=150.41 NODE_3612_length_2011_cov_2.670913:148-1920(+)